MPDENNNITCDDKRTCMIKKKRSFELKVSTGTK